MFNDFLVSSSLSEWMLVAGEMDQPVNRPITRSCYRSPARYKYSPFFEEVTARLQRTALGRLP